MKQNLALIYGGYSSEWEISVKSGKSIAKYIDRERYNLYEVLISRKSWSVGVDGKTLEIDKSDFSFEYEGRKVKFDVAFIMIHGTPGENGQLQAYFEMIGLKYTGCSSRAATLSFDKFACKTYLKGTTINLAKDIFLRKGDEFNSESIVGELGLPLFVKPNQGGSSFGITKVKNLDDLAKAIEYAFKEDDSVLVEEYIQGREISIGIFSEGGNLTPLPITEIIPYNEYFDYEAKYLGESQEICPALIPDEIKDKVCEATKIIYRRFGCKGLVRMDFIIRGDDVYFLEINPIPGMTDNSIVPAQVRAAGIDMKKFVNSIIEY